MSWWSRLTNVVRSGHLDRDLEDEQRFHIETRADDLEATGMSRQEALEQATRQFGHRLLLRESSRDVKLLTSVESVWRDLRVGLRLIRKDTVVSSAAIVSLALAIGACTAAFSLIDALILRELPVRDPHRLVYVNRSNPGKGGDERFSAILSYPFFERVRQISSPQMEAFSMSHQSLRQAILPDAGGNEEKLRTQFVSGNAFHALGITAAAGRVLTPSDDVTPGAHQVAVISHAFWKRRLGGNPAAIGQWIQLEQRPYQIVGVAQAGFTGAQPGMLTDIWIPNMMFDGESLRSPTWNWLQVWGRLAPNAPRENVEAIVQTAVTNFESEQPSGGKARDQQKAELAIELRDAATGFSQVRLSFERPLLALGAIVAVVLLIACSNVANLLLARGAARTREMALRVSIGAGRRRLVQQVLVESSVLTLAATALGVLCATLAVPLIVGMLTTNENPVYLEARADWRALLFVAALGCLTTVFFGLAPALRASRTSPAEATALGDRHHTAHSTVIRPLLAVQVGFSLMVLFVAALLLRSFDRLLAVDLGFTPERLVLLSVESRDRLEPARARELNRQLLERVRSMAGVEAASMSGWALFRGWSWGNNLEVPGQGRAQTFRLAVSSNFFQTMGTRMLEGREFGAQDSDATTPIPIVVNATFARKYLSGKSAVGTRLTTTSRGQAVAYEIIGVADDVRDGSVRGEMNPFVFSPMSDPGGTLQVRSSLDARTLSDQLRAELPKVYPSLRLVDVTTQSALVGGTLLRERLLAVLSGFFATLGLALAAVGLYGVSTHAVVRRTREIGIRVTLGAQPSAIVRSVLGGVTLAIGAGIVAGLVGGLYFARFVQTFLYEVEPLSLSSLGLPLLGLTVVALLAAWSPARRATRIDPAEALRME
jgi:putative ABC transport system permease protein